jgi:hypothetical protein
VSGNNGVGPPEDFIKLFIDFHKEYESPTAFWRWSAYSIVGAMLRSRVFFQHGKTKIFPNTYIILLADSAQYRKGAPIEAARRLLTLVAHTKLFSGTASIQAVLDLLSQAIANKMTGVPIRGGAALITADELAAFFVSDPRLIPLLTDIWTPREKYQYHLRSTNSIEIDDLCPSLLAASNEIFLREVYDSRAVYGGLLGRTFMIKPDETRPGNSLMDEGTKSYDDKPLVDSLHKLRDLAGRVRISPDGIKVYNEWYHDLYNKYKNHPDKTGVIQRMHTQVIKIAIIVAAANYTLEISQKHIEDAILEVTNLKQNYELYVMSSGQSTLAQIGTKFLAALWEKGGPLSKKEFMMKNWSDVTAEDFEKLIETLMASDMISLTAMNGSDIAYKLTPKCLEMLNKKK